MTKKFQISGLCLATAMALVSTNASAVSVGLTPLSGVLGTPTPGTVVYRGDLGAAAGSAIINAISVADDSGGSGGSLGQFSGFDLDAIIISSKFCTTTACLVGAPTLNVFNYGGGSVFSKGYTLSPANAKLFGTDATGNAVDNAVATLGSFDANSDTAAPARFLSLGYAGPGTPGSILFNFISPTALTGYYVYLGEVGGNGENPAANVNLFGSGMGVPEPSIWAMMIAGIGFAGAAMRRRQRISLKYA